MLDMTIANGLKPLKQAVVQPKQAVKADFISFGKKANADHVNISSGLSSLDKLDLLAQKVARNSGVELDTKGGYVNLTPQQTKAIELVSAINAIKEIAAGKGKNITGPVTSPIENEKDSTWIKNSTIYNLSPRAMGGLVNSIKLLPTIRPNAIYLSPIFENNNGALYAQSGFDLDPDIYNKDLKLLNAGVPKDQQITPDELMKAFVDAAHLLDKTVGMDLIPHMGDWADTLIEKPELFRWVKVNDAKSGIQIGTGVNLTDKNDPDLKLNGGRTIQDEMKTELLKAMKNSGNENLKTLAEKMKDQSASEIFLAIKNKFPAAKDDMKNAVLHEVKQVKGLVNVPVAPWNGNQLPVFEQWIQNDGGGYPKFSSGGKEPYGNLTPFKFYHNHHDMTGKVDKSRPNEAAIKFFTEVFPKTREKYGLDFIRADMAKHGFDEFNNAGQGANAAELGYATADIWKQVIDRARDESQPGGCKAVAAIAEAFEEDMTKFANVGFDLTLGADQYWDPDPGSIKGRIEGTFNWIKTLANKFKAGEINKPISKMISADTHDCAVGSNRHRIDRTGTKGMELFMNLGLFTSAGEGKRPFYMMNGNEDGSKFQTNDGRDLTVTKGEMPLKNDTGFNKQYHRLFNAYDAVKNVLNHKNAQLSYNDSEGNVLGVTVKSPVGDVFSLVNKSQSDNSNASITVPGDLKSGDKGMVILDDKIADVKAGETKKFARVIGKKMFVNIPPAGAHVFKVVQPQSEPEWIEVSAKEVIKYIPDSNVGRVLKEAMKGDYEILPSENSKKNGAIASAELHTNGKKYLLTAPLNNPGPHTLGLKEI
jgi:hypothetical protein